MEINLERYLDSKQCLLLFDVLIKENVKNKDLFLESINISPSTYRRSKRTEQKMGKNIVKELCEYYNIKLLTREEIVHEQMYLTQIYNIYYYKINYNKLYILGKLDEKIANKDILYPIYMLFKLVLILDNNENFENIKTFNEYLYNEVMKYELYYTDELKELLYIVSNNSLIIKDSVSEMYCYNIAKQKIKEEKYIEAMYFINKAIELLLNNNNYNRLIDFNILLLECYLNIYDYSKYYNLASSLYYCCTNKFNDEQSIINKHYALSLIALKKYEQLKFVYKKINSITNTEVLCILIAKYNTNKEDYNLYYKEIMELLNDENTKKVLIIIDTYLRTNKTKVLQTINNETYKDLIKVLLN